MTYIEMEDRKELLLLLCATPDSCPTYKRLAPCQVVALKTGSSDKWPGGNTHTMSTRPEVYSDGGGGVYLRLVPHGALAQYGNLGSGLLLQSLNSVSLGTQDLAHKVELEKPQVEGERGKRETTQKT